MLKKITMFLLLAIAGIQGSAQDKKAAKEAAMQKLVASGDFVFAARMAFPMSMRSRVLNTNDYDLKITKNTIVAYLPYYGQAYTAPLDPSQGGIQFTSKEFDYAITDRKKGGWDISIKPKDNTDVQQMNLTIATNGNANLQVTLTNKQPISFSGSIQEPGKNK